MGPASPASEALSLNHQGSPTWYIWHPFLPMLAFCTEAPALSAPCPSPNKSPAGQQMRNHLRRGGFCLNMPPSQEDVSPNKQVAVTCTIWDPSSSGLFFPPLLEVVFLCPFTHTHTQTHTPLPLCSHPSDFIRPFLPTSPGEVVRWSSFAPSHTHTHTHTSFAPSHTHTHTHMPLPLCSHPSDFSCNVPSTERPPYPL